MGNVELNAENGQVGEMPKTGEKHILNCVNVNFAPTEDYRKRLEDFIEKNKPLMAAPLEYKRYISTYRKPSLSLSKGRA